MKNEETAKRLSYALNNSGLTQRELAERSGIKESSVSHYMNGSHAPSTLSAGKMSKVLNVNPLWLMGYDVSMETDNKNTSCDNNDSKTMKLCNLFNKLNNEAQDKVISYLEDLSSMSKYKK